MSLKYRACKAHAGHLVHAVPVKENGEVVDAALCGKDRRNSRRCVWYGFEKPLIVTCALCLAKLKSKGITA